VIPAVSVGSVVPDRVETLGLTVGVGTTSTGLATKGLPSQAANTTHANTAVLTANMMPRLFLLSFACKPDGFKVKGQIQRI
jgi:hypothetical protein